MSDSTIWAVIVGMGVINFTVRFVPIAILSRIRLPRPIMRWLQFIPIGVMGALVSNAVVRPDGRYVAPWANPWLFATGVTALAYRLTRSFLGATVIGMASFVLFRALLAG